MLVMNPSAKNILTLANILFTVYFICQEVYASNWRCKCFETWINPRNIVCKLHLTILVIAVKYSIAIYSCYQFYFIYEINRRIKIGLAVNISEFVKKWLKSQIFQYVKKIMFLSRYSDMMSSNSSFWTMYSSRNGI